VADRHLFTTRKRHGPFTYIEPSRTAVIVRPMRVLITNDDGIGAPGLAALVRGVAAWVKVGGGDGREALVVAPHMNQSGTSSAVGDVFGRDGVAYERYVFDGAEHIMAYSLEATPALCTIIAALGSFDYQPDVVISGINAGANVGRSVLHSGTIGAILTGAQLGLSGLAVSVQWGEDVHYDTAAAVAMQVLTEMEHAPDRTLLNLNVPNRPLSELRGVRRGRISVAGLIKGAGPRAGGEPLGESGLLPLRLGAATPQVGDVSDEEPEDDGALVVAGFASLTPLRGVHEDTDALTDEVMRRSLAAVTSHLQANVSPA
jgi:5'-nucleotidase